MNLKLQPVKILCLIFSIGMIATFLTSCNDDEATKKIPTVETGAITDVNTTFATASGEITDDGNSKVTTAGFVYSKTSTTPTITENDGKVEITDTEGEFTADLDELTSGTDYHVRAFATNSKGTGYGDAVTFTSGNAPPVATNVTVTGEKEVNKELTATYAYSDAEGNTEGTSTYKWYMANDATGTGEVAIAGATELTYTIEEAAQGKYIRFGVTPKAGTGPEGSRTGVEVKSAFSTAVGEATTVTFMYRGNEVTYGIIVSETTEKRWLDRNLGAPSVATAHNDYANYGDLFQWGRKDDGHQTITRTGTGNTGATMTGTTAVMATTATYTSNVFVLAANDDGDWLTPPNASLWQGVPRVNNPCPTGWHVPTRAEWEAEGILSIGGTSDSDGFKTLKLTLTGLRQANSGNLFLSNLGNYWTTTVDSENPIKAMRFAALPSAFVIDNSNRGSAMACRCIKD